MMAVSADKMSLITVFDQPSINRACKEGSRQHVKFDRHVRNDLLDPKVKQAITLALRAASSSELFGKMFLQQDWESWHKWDNDMFFQTIAMVMGWRTGDISPAERSTWTRPQFRSSRT